MNILTLPLTPTERLERRERLVDDLASAPTPAEFWALWWGMEKRDRLDLLESAEAGKE